MAGTAPEERGELSRCISGAWRIKHRAPDGDSLRAGANQLGNLACTNAADRKHNPIPMMRRGGCHESGATCCTRELLGLGGIAGSKAGVVGGPFPCGAEFAVIVGGDTQESIRSEQGARIGRREIVFADMCAVCIELHSQCNIVVDDEERVGGVGVAL